jgi:hypothetical protein
MHLISVITLLSSFYSFAGIDLRIGGGLNLSNELRSNDIKLDDSYTKKFHVGLNIGANAAVYFTQQLGIIAGLAFETRGSGWKQGETSADFAMNYLQVPALFSFRPIPALAIDLGPEFGIFLNGSGTVGEGTMDLTEINRIDLGASAVVEYTIMNKIAVGAGYYYGFLDNDESISGTITNTNIKVFVAYVLHLRE